MAKRYPSTLLQRSSQLLNGGFSELEVDVRPNLSRAVFPES